MSKHSKNCTSSSVFTYRERQKLKGVYGTNEERIGQDSIKTFEMCTICNCRLIEPTSCDQGHMFCRSCVVEFLVKQKKKIAENQLQVQKYEQKKELIEKEKQMQKEVAKLEAFQKYDTFSQVTNRKQFSQGGLPAQSSQSEVTQKDVKPIGIYELNPKKNDYVKTAFWSLQNAPKHVEKVQQFQKVVYCPGTGKQHKLTLKKLRNIKVKEVEKEFLCWICSKQIKRQKIGSYKCGHAVCQSCKSNKCQMCEQSSGWLNLESSSSSFAAHSKAEVKTYSHAFVG